MINLVLNSLIIFTLLILIVLWVLDLLTFNLLLPSNYYFYLAGISIILISMKIIISYRTNNSK